DKACELNYGIGCSALGIKYEGGLYGVKKDSKKALQYLSKACELNEKEGCFRLGEMQKDGEGVVKNIKQAVKTFEKACRLGSEDACGILNNY
ncbi:sel1 repeat family protein, partial [Helicobacter pylori]|nr:sel1 repeat family protein [Helicobacter pylori]